MIRIDIHTHLGVDPLFYAQRHYPYALDLPTLADEGAREGITHWVSFPMVTHGALSLSALREGRIEAGRDALEAVPYAWENERLLHEIDVLFPDLGRRILPFLMIDPSRATEAQAEALRRLHERRPVRGLKIQATIIRSPIRALLGEGGVLLDFAERESLPVLIHTSIDPADLWSQVADILDVVRARPAIRFCLAHSCRFSRSGLDAVAALPNAWFDCSAHVIACRLAVRNHPAIVSEPDRFSGDYRDPAGVLAGLAEAYPDKLLWGSDAPFHSYVDSNISMFCSYAEEATPLRLLPQEIQERIAHRNPLRFLGLDRLP